MVRWEPGARERLRAAALDLFVAHGFDGATTEEIARAAGVTERTFFRYFPDKREVLFDGGEQYRASFTEAIDAAPATASTLDLIGAALDGVAAFFAEDRRDHARRRQHVIDAQPALRERELLKRAGTTAAVTAALDRRGVPATDAVVAGEATAALFHVAFARWVAIGETRTMPQLADEALGSLRALALQPSPPALVTEPAR